MVRALLTLIVLGLAACGAKIEAISPEAIGAVQADIRRQVDLYVRASAFEPFFIRDGVVTPLTPPGTEYQCGNGNIHYDITQVQADLSVLTTSEGGLSIGATLPVSAVTTVGVSGSFSRSEQTTQTLRYNLWPLPNRRTGAPLAVNPVASDLAGIVADLQQAPIAATLLNLRNQQIISAMVTNPISQRLNPVARSCFANFNLAAPSTSPGNLVTMGLTVTGSLGTKVSVGIGPVAVGLSDNYTRTTGNSLTISFAQPGIDEAMAAADRVAAACKDGNQTSRACHRAREAYLDLLNDPNSPGHGIGILRERTGLPGIMMPPPSLPLR